RRPFSPSSFACGTSTSLIATVSGLSAVHVNLGDAASSVGGPADSSVGCLKGRSIEMTNRSMYVKQATTVAIALSVIALSSIGGADGVVEKRASNIADQELFFAPVPKAVCGPGDNPEQALQGQVPIALRMQPGGYQGNSCNLKLLGQVRGEGAN